MLKVILADDHYPVLELLSKSIPWSELGLEVMACCSNGLEVLEQCGAQAPDILVTDIGMPRMDGLACLVAVREINPDLEVVILSCHDEFHYAQKALKAGVKEYILKESLQPEELTEILRKLSHEIQERARAKLRNDQLVNVLDRNTSTIKSEFIRSLISTPMINEHKWLMELQQLGVKDVTLPHMPVLVYPNRTMELRQRFQTEELFMYAMDNVIHEVIDMAGLGVSFRYNAKQSLLLFPFVKNLKVNPYEVIRGHLATLLRAFERIGIKVSALTYEPASNLHELKKHMIALLGAQDQRFYAAEGISYKWVPFKTSETDLFAYYQRAVDEFKPLIALESEDYGSVVREWVQFLKDERFKAEAVRSWVLKIMMEIELKYQSLQYFQPRYGMGELNAQIGQMDSIHEVEKLFSDFIREKISLAHDLKQTSQRHEIHEAKKYVTARLHEKISMEEAATYLKLNPSHFSRIFKQETGETFIEYVTRLKMEQAKDKLDHSDDTVEQIAESLGYENSSYFIKLFKSYSGYSPKDYRQIR
jgi:two-component system, response regulator YesN